MESHNTFSFILSCPIILIYASFCIHLYIYYLNLSNFISRYTVNLNKKFNPPLQYCTPTRTATFPAATTPSAKEGTYVQQQHPELLHPQHLHIRHQHLQKRPTPTTHAASVYTAPATHAYTVTAHVSNTRSICIHSTSTFSNNICSNSTPSSQGTNSHSSHSFSRILQIKVYIFKALTILKQKINVR